jgi:hypothetical protein
LSQRNNILVNQKKSQAKEVRLGWDEKVNSTDSGPMILSFSSYGREGIDWKSPLGEISTNLSRLVRAGKMVGLSRGHGGDGGWLGL